VAFPVLGECDYRLTVQHPKPFYSSAVAADHLRLTHSFPPSCQHLFCELRNGIEIKPNNIPIPLEAASQSCHCHTSIFLVSSYEQKP